ncbi:hybrid sensor histidine kinase/response regulator [Pelagicoccus mobilis]|uniref:histidine kinase n=1 Tax=Pelagicoccus mobilis TaxID=415221 RepID=A0A934S1S3_9BACT|nr:hybrid sensor histidine kinase/response regulator [Pelagicoccus mobilis]MBK1879585.1 hybrid sensor histidine kinase/response regulator [Pelagicoccus mobilis]
MTHSKKKILLIDDDPSVSAALLMLLKDEYETHAAGTVSDGVRLFDALRPNLVILDLHLPDQHGLDALRSIRKINRSARVVILTGFATLEVVEESMRLGASDCLHKPFDASSLRTRLRELANDEVPEDGETEVSASGHVEKAEVGLVSSAFLHDVGNPLTSLQALALLLRENNDDADTCKKLGKMIGQNVAYLGALVDQWRAFSEPETLKPDFATLAEIAEDAVGFVALRAESKAVQVDLEAEESDLLPKLNRHATARILVNLLQNAIEAVARGEGRVEFRARVRGDMAEFVVRDNGAGIPSEITEHIFEARYTTKKKGSGLGLFIARHIVEAAKGAIAVCSRPGRGSAFTVRLPVS